jgi:formate dehydrogenase maturation protein FdhE
MSFSGSRQMPGTKTGEPRPCPRCGAEPRLVHTVLDSNKGRSIRMFRCQCGEQTWLSEKA